MDPPADWKDVIIRSTAILNDAYITPCYTMTIGYPDETDEDVEKSIEMVEDIYAEKLRAWVFPLPVIPMGTSRIRQNPFPVMERLPKKYWELLYVSWKHDLEVTRQVFPYMTRRVGNGGAVRYLVNMIMDRTFSHIEGIFKELMETNGQKAREFSRIELNSFFGLMKTIYWLGTTVFTPPSKKEEDVAVSPELTPTSSAALYRP